MQDKILKKKNKTTATTKTTTTSTSTSTNEKIVGLSNARVTNVCKEFLLKNFLFHSDENKKNAIYLISFFYTLVFVLFFFPVKTISTYFCVYFFAFLLGYQIHCSRPWLVLRIIIIDRFEPN